MEMNGLNRAVNVTRYETNNFSAALKEKETPIEKNLGQKQDKLEISKEALAAAEMKNANPTQESEQKPNSKISDEERAGLVESLKEKMEQDQAKFFDFVRKTLTKQGQAFEKTDDVWKFIASGDYEVDANTKAEAKDAISENGYYGVNQVSNRIFDFALALTGGDPEKMQQMEAAFEEGFKEATKSWGGNLPGISNQTYDAVKEKFAAFYNEN